MHKFLLCQLILMAPVISNGQDFTEIVLDSDINAVQPMTGVVFWPGNRDIMTDAISLEYSYMLYSDVVEEEGIYDWSVVEELLDEITSRNHQAVLRFRYTYPGRTTAVPAYIKALEDYKETEGVTENQATWFPDWTHPELQRFTLEFYEKYAERYDQDRRLAYVQTGFGLWAEYHIYDGPFKLGETFPSKEFQTSFFAHLDTVFQETNWSISIDAASSTYSPFEAQPELLSHKFGLFDDSFMHGGHHGYNTSNWNFFNRDRYKWAPAGGEFSYYSTYDQRNVLNEHVGAYGIPFEHFVEDFRMSYINGNDQNSYQTLERIKAASMYMGYRFKINSFKVSESASIVEIENVGVAPFYYDAFVTVNGVRSTTSLKLLSPGAPITVEVASGGSNPVLTIESDRILETQEIQYYGTINEPYVYVKQEIEEILSTKPVKQSTEVIIIRQQGQWVLQAHGSLEQIVVYDIHGKKVINEQLHTPSSDYLLDTTQLTHGIYIIHTNLGSVKWLKH